MNDVSYDGFCSEMSIPADLSRSLGADLSRSPGADLNEDDLNATIVELERMPRFELDNLGTVTVKGRHKLALCPQILGAIHHRLRGNFSIK